MNRNMTVRAHLAGRIVGFFATLVVGGLLYALFNQPVETALSYGQSMSSRSVTSQNITLFGQIWDGLLFAVLLTAGLMIIAAAVYESQG